jgi:hypothetical protein
MTFVDTTGLTITNKGQSRLDHHICLRGQGNYLYTTDEEDNLEGIITRSELMKIYRKEMMKRVMIKH